MQTNLTALCPVQDSGEVDTQPNQPSGGSIASSETSRLPPWYINDGPGNNTNTIHRRQLSAQREIWGSVSGHRVAPWALPEAVQDHPG